MSLSASILRTATGAGVVRVVMQRQRQAWVSSWGGLCSLLRSLSLRGLCCRVSGEGKGVGCEKADCALSVWKDQGGLR